MCEGRSAVVLQRAEHRIGVDLIARAGQITAAVIAAHVVAERGNRAGVIVNVFARTARVEDCISGFDCRAAVEAVIVVAMPPPELAELPLIVLLVIVSVALLPF